MSQSSTLLDALRETGQAIIQEGSSGMPTVQNNVSECERAWERLKCELQERDRLLGKILDLWEHYLASECELRRRLKDSEVDVESLDLEVPADITEVHNRLDKAKVS